MAAFFNLTIFFVYLVATRVIAISLDIPVLQWIDRLGGYWVLALIGTAVLVPLDFILSAMSLVVLKRLPAPTSAARSKKIDSHDPAKSEKGGGNDNPLGLPDADADKTADGKNGEQKEKRYDIFGYEIIDDEEDKK